MSLEARRTALLALVEADRLRQREALLDTANAQADALRRQARAQARAHIRQALDEARERRAGALAAAEARRQTRERLARQHHDSDALAAAWATLPEEMERRWHEPAARALWIANALSRAARELDGVGGRWTVRHAAGPAAAELAAAVADAPAAVDVIVDPGSRGGLRIARDGNVLDASIAGLLGDRDAVSAAILRGLGTVA